ANGCRRRAPVDGGPALAAERCVRLERRRAGGAGARYRATAPPAELLTCGVLGPAGCALDHRTPFPSPRVLTIGHAGRVAAESAHGLAAARHAVRAAATGPREG